MATLRLFFGAGEVGAVSLSARAANDLASLLQRAPATESILLLAAAGGDVADLRSALRAAKRLLPAAGTVGIVTVSCLHRWVSRLRGGKEAAPRGPSLRSVLTGLREAGFTPSSILAIAPTEGDNRELRAISLLRAWNAERHLVLARARTPGTTSRIDSIIGLLQKALAGGGAEPRCRLLRLISSAKDKSIAFVGCGSRPIVIRLPASQAAHAAEANAYATLQALDQERRLAARVPRPVLASTAGDQAFFCETGLSGKALASVLSPANRAHYASEVSRLLHEMNPPVNAATARADRRSVTEVLPALLDPVLTCIGEPQLRQRTSSLIRSALSGAMCRMGRVHGDLSVRNILVQGRAISGLIDWENSQPAAPLLLDAFNYLDSAQRHCSGRMTLADTIHLLAEGEWPVDAELALLKDQFGSCGADFRFRKGFALLYFLAHVGPQLRFGGESANARKRVLDTLARVLPESRPAPECEPAEDHSALT